MRAMLVGHPAIAVVRDTDPGRALEFAVACIGAGFSALEITTTVPDSVTVVAKLRERFPATLIGAGTILTSGQAVEHAEAGAAFLVAPGIDPDLVRLCQRIAIAVMPGVLTPSEINAAALLGLNTVKLFPADTVGIGHLAAVRSVFREMDFVPSGGVTDANVPAWRAAGAMTVCLGSDLMTRWLRDDRQGLEAYLLKVNEL